MDEKYLKRLCRWVKSEKGITKIDLMELVEFVPEYEEWLEEQKKVWTNTSVNCDLCRHKWQAVHHIESDRLECPNCNNMTIF